MGKFEDDFLRPDHWDGMIAVHAPTKEEAWERMMDEFADEFEIFEPEKHFVRHGTWTDGDGEKQKGWVFCEDKRGAKALWVSRCQPLSEEQKEIREAIHKMFSDHIIQDIQLEMEQEKKGKAIIRSIAVDCDTAGHTSADDIRNGRLRMKVSLQPFTTTLEVKRHE